MKLKWISFQVSPGLALEARITAAKQNITRSELVRRALKRYLKQTSGGDDHDKVNSRTNRAG